MLSQGTSAFILILLVDMVFTQCSVGCKLCSGSICTICESSYFLSNDLCSPCPKNCESCNSLYDCTSCKPNKYGSVCKYNCSLCENERCGLRTCSSGCRVGYYEVKDYLYCHKCPLFCKHCTDWQTCYNCNDGYFLLKFNESVRCEHCAPYFKNSQCPACVIYRCKQCQIHNDLLVCADCREGQIFNGKTCVSHTSLCSKECSTYCDSTGICQGECNDGWTGEKCSEKCNSKCSKCSKDNGNNCLLCVGNFYTTDCNLACNPSCIVKSGHHTCEHAEGFCLNGCNQTYWGDLCDKPCPDRCKDLKCDRNNGTCTDGCKDGLTGNGCSKTTTIAIQETSLTTTTSAKIVTQQQAFVQRDDKASIFTIGYFSGFGSCAAIVVFAVLFKLIRRRFIAGKTSQNNKPNVEIPTYYNTRTDFRAVNIESADVTNNYESLGNNRTTDNVYNDLGTTLS